MRLYYLSDGMVLEHEGRSVIAKNGNWDQWVNRDDLFSFCLSQMEELPEFLAETGWESSLKAPLVSQEIWASGVTYFRSREARMEESQDGGDVYDRVYEADRPELFFKATAARTAHPGGIVNIRKDSSWDVPEPELTLFITSNKKIVGYTIGNDMSSRSIEGENPLYLPQAKVYEKCAAIGPCLWVTEEAISPETEIVLDIYREQALVFNDRIPLSQMKRKHTELVDYLFQACDFPMGCYLMTGTGIVPPNEFSLRKDDEVKITIEPIGTLINVVGEI